MIIRPYNNQNNTPMPNLILIKATHDLTDAAFKMMVEIGKHDQGFIGLPEGTNREDFPAYIDKLIEMSQGINIKKDWVPMTTFWLIRDDCEVIGIGRLRHRLNDKLREYGGHIGCRVNTSEQDKGYGTILLSKLCDEAAKMGIDRVLVTCLTTNIPSKRIIENNGGVLEREGIDEEGKPIYLYWIDLE